MIVFVVVSIKRGSSGSLYVETRKAFREKQPALDLANKLNEDQNSDAWSFVCDTEVV